MTVKMLQEKLKELIDAGLGEKQVYFYGPDELHNAGADAEWPIAQVEEDDMCGGDNEPSRVVLKAAAS